MHGTQADSTGTAQVTGVVQFRYDRYVTAMNRLGHHSERTRARAAGITRMTVHRWRTEPICRTPASAHKVAAFCGLTVDQLFEPIAAAEAA